jgi:hypothetical protein
MPKKCKKCSRFITTDREYCNHHSGVVPQFVAFDEDEKPDSL